MRRTILALAGSLLSVAILVGLKAAPTASLLGWSAEAGLGPGDTSTGEGGGGTDPGTGASDPADAQPSGGPAATPGPSASRSPGATMTTPAPGASTAKPTTAPANSQQFTGAPIAVKTAQSPTVKSSSCGSCASYSISVTITVSGGRITSSSTAYSPTPGGESRSDADRAKNQLSPAVLSAQTWNLGRVSGATYAGNAWELSAKDAMSKAGLPV